MACLGLEHGVAEWKAQTNPLSYGGTPKYQNSLKIHFYPDCSNKIVVSDQRCDL